MPTCKKEFEVTCRLEDAFEHVADWRNYKSFMSMFLDLKPVSLVEYGPGLSLETTIALGQTEITTTLDLVEFHKNGLIGFKSTRGIRAKLYWEFKVTGRKTVITFTFEYELPPGLTNLKSDHGAIEKELEDSANRSIELLQWVLNSLPPTEEGAELDPDGV